MSEVAIAVLLFTDRWPRSGKVTCEEVLVVRQVTISTERSRQLRSDSLDIAVYAAVAAFPPMTEGQKERIAHLLLSSMEADEPQRRRGDSEPVLSPAGSGVAGNPKSSSRTAFRNSGASVSVRASDSDRRFRKRIRASLSATRA